jgi:plasmid rolling circle replication initiator protein Rep
MPLVQGEGSPLSNTKAVKRRAKTKAISQHLNLALIEVAKETGAKEMEKTYRNAFYCQDTVKTANNRIYATLCKTRFCTYCSGVRKAELINKYYYVIKNWQNVYFLTLTSPSVKAGDIKGTFRKMAEIFRLINAKLRKRSQRGTGNIVMGIRTLECNFNPTAQTYNPHFHLLVNGEQAAELLREEWMAAWKPTWLNPEAQHNKRVRNTEKDLVEVIKYGAKIFTEPGKTKAEKKKRRNESVIYARALHNIYTAMKGERLLDRFGFNLPKDTPKRESKLTEVDEVHLWRYKSRFSDWLHPEHESTLTGYIPSFDDDFILERKIDTTRA